MPICIMVGGEEISLATDRGRMAFYATPEGEAYLEKLGKKNPYQKQSKLVVENPDQLAPKKKVRKCDTCGEEFKVPYVYAHQKKCGN